MFDNYPDIMTMPQVSEALQIGRTSAYMLANRNLLEHIRIGQSIRVPKSCLIKYVESNCIPIENG
jgi:excisionase family DNA binding protein